MPRFVHSPEILTATALAATFAMAACEKKALPSSCAAAGSPAVLYVTQAEGFAHPVLGHSAEVLAGLASKSGSFHLAWQRDAASALSSADLARCSAVVFFTRGEPALSADQKAALLSFVREGGGFVGLHSASDSFYSWPEYGQLVGARFDGHPWTGTARVAILEPEHPATRGLPQSWTVNDEIYQFKEFAQGQLTVLAALDTASVDMKTAGVHVNPWGFPLVWMHPFGKGNVFYSALGHQGMWDDDRFRQLILGGIQSALRK